MTTPTKPKQLSIEIALAVDSSAPDQVQVRSISSNEDLLFARPKSVPVAVPSASPPRLPPEQPPRLPPQSPPTSQPPPPLPTASVPQVPTSAPPGSNKIGWVLLGVVLVMGFVVWIKSCTSASSALSDQTAKDTAAVATDTTETRPFVDSTAVAEPSPPVVDTSPSPSSEPAASPGTSFANSMTDPRDGRTYKTIKIGNQVWMAENVNHATDGSWCYENDESNCTRYGRLYEGWAMGSACPSGWHVPSDGEWKILERSLGIDDDQLEKTGYRGTKEGRMLKSAAGWKDDANGTDEYGFQVLPAGGRLNEGRYGDLGMSTCFWSSTTRSQKSGWGRCFNQRQGGISRGFLLNSLSFSVRCLKDK